MRALAIAVVLFLLTVSAGAADVPRSATTTDGGFGSVDAISCTGAGECAAGGYYIDSLRDVQAFVVSETNGSWGDAIKVPGTAKLNKGGDASVDAISCVAPGECAAGGEYTDGRSDSQAFVASETHGIWSDAIEVPGMAELNAGGEAYVVSISCGAAGDCAAGGVYYDRYNNAQAFVVSEANGSWGNAIKVRVASLNGSSPEVDSISCAAAGECVAGGSYQDGFDADGGLRLQAFVVSETNGSWGDPIEVPGTAILNAGASAEVNSISCPTAGNCAAGGDYLDSHYRIQAFVAGATHGSWGNAIKVPGTSTLNTGGEAQVNSISCAAAGKCAAGGYYWDANSGQQAFVVGETNGSWATAIEVPGTANLNSSNVAEVDSISCAAAGECAAGGFYDDREDNEQVFVVSEENGTWGNAIEVPGTATLNTGGDAQAYEVSCGAPGDCAAGGFYNPVGRRRPLERAFVASETNGTWGHAGILGGIPALCDLPSVVGEPLREAEKRLHAAGCRVGEITHVDSNRPKGDVVAQRPRAPRLGCEFGCFRPHKLVSVRTAVRLKVSKG